MAHHEDHALYTGVLVIRAWGRERFEANLRTACNDITAGRIPYIEGVTYESDPGGSGGPGGNTGRFVQRKFDFIMDGVGLTGEPQYPAGDDTDDN